MAQRVEGNVFNYSISATKTKDLVLLLFNEGPYFISYYCITKIKDLALLLYCFTTCVNCRV